MKIVKTEKVDNEVTLIVTETELGVIYDALKIYAKRSQKGTPTRKVTRKIQHIVDCVFNAWYP